MPSLVKDPAAHLDYRFDWSAWLEDGDTITSASVTTDPGLTETAETHTDTSVTVWVSGGDAGSSYTVTCRITTAQGRTDERSMTLMVRDR